MSSTTDTSFADRLREIRDKRELSQSELARRAGLQPSAIAHFEAGRRKPSFANIRALATALTTTADTLLGTDAGTTAFRNEENLNSGDREHIQGIIDMMVSKKKK